MSIWEPLKELYDEAKQKGLWFYCYYQCMWFSPDELAKKNENNQLRWGPVNWQLRDPNELLKEIEQRIRSEKEKLEDVKARIKN
jgi:hypothetical protein